MSFENYEESRYGLNLNLLTILYKTVSFHILGDVDSSEKVTI